MYSRTRFVIGMLISLATAALMIAGRIDQVAGLAVGTFGMLIVATHSSPRISDADQVHDL